MGIEDARAKRAVGGDRLWWTWRVLDEVLLLGDAASDADLRDAVDSFLTIAAEDPDWATRKLADRGPDGHRLAQLLSYERLKPALDRVALPSLKQTAMLRARMLIASISWRRPSANDGAIWREALDELDRVPEEGRDAGWRYSALRAAAEVDYPRFLDLARRRLSELSKDFDISMFLPGALAVSAKAHDWSTFDEWLAQYNGLPEPLRRDHSQCAIINLEGLRALDETRSGDAVKQMSRLLDAAPATQFLSNDDISALPKRLRAEGLALDLCDKFDELVKKKDWRLLKK